MDIREAIDHLRKEDLVDIIDAEVDPYLEISHITDLVQKKNGKALFFKNVKGSSIPILTNLFGNGRLKQFLQVNNYDEIGKKIEKLLNIGKDIKSAFSFELFKTLKNFKEKKVKNHNWQVFSGNLDDIPALFSWPKDGGYFYNLGLTHTYNYRTKSKNVGLYRIQRFDSNKLILHWQLHKDGKSDYDDYINNDQDGKMTIYITFSSPPSLIYAASAPLPKEINEYNFAGFLNQNPLKTIQLDKEIPLTVSTDSEIVIKATIKKGDMALEGPYGDHTGYYTPQEKFPLCEIEEIWCKESPIMVSTVVTKPPCEDVELGKATERIFLPLIKIIIPEIIDYDLPSSGVFHNCLLVKIKKKYPKQAYKVIYGILGLGMLSLTKLIIVFDEDCDIHNYYEASWYALGNVDYKKDILLLEGPVDHLDHASYNQFYGGKMGVDATRKTKEEGYYREYPEKITYSEDMLTLIKAKVDIYKLSNKLFD